MKYTIRIAALVITIPTLIVVYSDLLKSDKEGLAKVEAVGVIEADIQEGMAKPVTFTYQEILMNAEMVVVPVPEYASTPKSPSKQYDKLIQVASFKSKQRAETLIGLLNQKSMPNVQLVKSKTSDWYSVTVGPFGSRSLLNKAQDELAQMNYVTQVYSLK